MTTGRSKPPWPQRLDAAPQSVYSTRRSSSDRHSVSATLELAVRPRRTSFEFPLAADRCGSDCFCRASPQFTKDFLMSFSDLGLLPELLRAVADKGYDSPSPIQLQAIPAVLAGRDVLAGAQTGTGKTAGFVLPILQRLKADQEHGSNRAPRALVLTPTR